MYEIWPKWEESQAGRPIPHGVSCSSLVTVLTSANASQSNVVSYKIHKPRPKGLSHNKMGPHAVLQLNPKPETVYGKNMQPLINKTVDRRAEKGQAQAGQPRPGRPVPQLLSFGPTHLKPTSSGNQERAAKKRQTMNDIPRPASPPASFFCATCAAFKWELHNCHACVDSLAYKLSKP